MKPRTYKRRRKRRGKWSPPPPAPDRVLIGAMTLYMRCRASDRTNPTRDTARMLLAALIELCPTRTHR